MSDLDKAIFLAAFLTNVVVIALLFYRRISRTLPAFCAYCIWDLSSNLTVYAINRYHPGIFFQAYFTQTILDSALIFCVLVELAWSVLRPVRASLPRGALVVVGVSILLLSAAIWPFAALPGLAHALSTRGLVLAQLQQTTSILRVLIFLLLAAGSQFLSIGWRDRELQVATGLGLYSLVSLTVSMLHQHLATASQYHYLGEVVVISYLCCLLYWVLGFAQKEAERREFTPQMRSMLLAVAGAARTTRVALEDPRADKSQKQDQR
jgi:hypothetical protein